MQHSSVMDLPLFLKFKYKSPSLLHSNPGSFIYLGCGRVAPRLSKTWKGKECREGGGGWGQGWRQGRGQGQAEGTWAGPPLPEGLPGSRGGARSKHSQALSQSVFPRMLLICTFLFLCDVTIALS